MLFFFTNKNFNKITILDAPYLSNSGYKLLMNPTTPRKPLALYLSLIGLLSVYYAFHQIRIPGSYAMGDFLINYTGGFVRRGLLGEIFRLLSLLTHINSLWFVFLLQAVAFSIFLVVVYRLAVGLRWTYALNAVIFSPATCAFMALTPAESMRKEIILYALLALLCLRWFARLRDATIIILLLLLTPFLILTHDALLFYLPYVFAAVVLQCGSLTRACKLMAFSTAATILAALAVAKHPGNKETATAICSSLGTTLQPFGSQNTNVCSGSIVWLQISFTQAHKFTVSCIQNYHFFRSYIPLILLVILPAALVLHTLYYHYRLHHEVLVVVGCSLISWAASSLLFYIAVDWDRWISMHAVCMMLLLLLLSSRIDIQSIEVSTPPSQAHRFASATALFLYLFAVTLVMPSTHHEYVDIYHYLRNVDQQHTYIRSHKIGTSHTTAISANTKTPDILCRH